VSSSGTPHARFQRAVERRHLPAAEAAAYELGRLTLADALLLLLLIAEKAPEKFERAAVRWVGRFAVETAGLRVPDLQLVLGAVAGLREPVPRLALETLAAVAERFKLGSVATAARRAQRGA
jgi:hypothetical protein